MSKLSQILENSISFENHFHIPLFRLRVSQKLTQLPEFKHTTCPIPVPQSTSGCLSFKDTLKAHFCQCQ